MNIQQQNKQHQATDTIKITDYPFLIMKYSFILAALLAGSTSARRSPHMKPSEMKSMGEFASHSSLDIFV